MSGSFQILQSCLEMNRKAVD